MKKHWLFSCKEIERGEDDVSNYEENYYVTTEIMHNGGRLIGMKKRYLDAKRYYFEFR
ncbi:MAG: hypothetical protein A370_03192 [Clostridium sp. Maddingley MBC34-26]|nr:MAG: hypothetical protein A370_03192 [Clostridium sp. Maddingley MBC34-26]